jgi:ribosome-binding factor A
LKSAWSDNLALGLWLLTLCSMLYAINATDNKQRTVMEHKRADRIADLILKELAEVLLRKVKDPRVTDITLTNVEVSADLRHAKVYYSLLGDDEKRSKATVGLESARGFVKRELGKRLQLRRIPDISFCFDASLEHGSHIDRLLAELKESDH